MNKIDISTGSDLKVLLLGSTGLLGSTLKPFLDSLGYDVATHSRSNEAPYQADLTDPIKSTELLDDIQPKVVINLVGLTDVDKCEVSPNQAYLVNVQAVENITDWIKQKKTSCHLIQISTDQVYDGAGLHAEETVALKNYYAFSKYAGELAAKRVSSTILRTNFFGRSQCSNRKSLTDWLFSSLLKKESIQVFDDVLFNPLSMSTLSEMIGLTIQKKPIGVFNLGAHEGMSKADFAFSFAEELSFSHATMKRTSTNQVSFLKTYRPKDMRMECSKVESALDVKLPFLNDEIKRVAREYNEKS
jgi:dTDP-4-dehydrorhamnose reductase